MKRSFAIIAGLAIALSAAPAFAEMLTFKATLDGKSETPPNDSKGTGTADIQIDTDAKIIAWTIKSSGLTGPATMAHFHGPADPGAKAPPEIDISKMIEKGTSPLTDAQLADFKAGKIYVNIHTAKFPDGEIRGQVTQ